MVHRAIGCCCRCVVYSGSILLWPLSVLAPLGRKEVGEKKKERERERERTPPVVRTSSSPIYYNHVFTEKWSARRYWVGFVKAFSRTSNTGNQFSTKRIAQPCDDIAQTKGESLF